MIGEGEPRESDIVTIGDEDTRVSRSGDSEDLGSWIRSMRTAIDLNQRDLAAKAGISQSYLCDIELGRGGTPSLAVLDRLASALGAQKADLLKIAGVLESGSRDAQADSDNRVLMVVRNLSPEGKATVEQFARFVLAEEHRWIQQNLLDNGQEKSQGSESAGPRLFD